MEKMRLEDEDRKRMESLEGEDRLFREKLENKVGNGRMGEGKTKRNGNRKIRT